jgi:hypothetical protein
MTPDPVTVALLSGAAGGVGGQLVKEAWKAVGSRWLATYFKDHAPKAQEKAQQNVAEFLTGLAVRVNRLADAIGSPPEMQRRLEAGLQDPDFSVVLKGAILSAARSSNRIKHTVLARAVAERLAAAPESTEALASSIAVEAIPRLSAVHLTLLRVAAIVYAIRPPGLPLPDEPPEGTDGYGTSPTERQALTGYPDWLRTALAVVPRGNEVKASDYTHLASSGCLIVERRVWLDIEDVLRPTGRRLLSLAAVGGYGERVRDFLGSDGEGRALTSLWEDGLRHVVLAPAGLLIGTAAHDVQSQSETPISWATAPAAFLAPPEHLEIWDGRDGLSRQFMDVLGREIQDLASRDVGFWRHFDRS